MNDINKSPAHTRRRTAATFERAGSRIHYWTSGGDDGPTVICIHGVTLDHGTWDGQVPALLDAGYRVITWDLRGHGASRPMGEGLSIHLATQDLKALLDKTEVARSVLVGQSFGGSVAQEFLRLYPDRVSALVLVGAPELGHRYPLQHRLFGRTRPLVLRLWPERHLRRTIPAFMSAKPEVQRYVAEANQALSKADFVAVTRAALEGMLGYDRAEELDVPVLLTHGENEAAWLVGMLRSWAASDALVTCHPVPGAGHLANHDSPTAFNETLIGFLGRLPISG